MARTESKMVSLGSLAPTFELPDTNGQMVSLSSFKGAPLLVMFICNHCPYVIHVRDAMIAMCRDFQKLGVHVVAINSNDAEAYPEDSPEKMREYAQKFAYPFPYLFDASQEVARAYDAACTPDFFLYDRNHLLVYRGQMDQARPGNGRPNDAADLRQAVTAMLKGQPQARDQKPSLGCNIKWKK